MWPQLQKLGHRWTSPNYLDQLRKDVFVIIRQSRPPTFFVTFMTCINNCPTLIETLKQLYEKYTSEKTIRQKGNSPTIRGLAKNDRVICVWYYAHRMNNFRKLFKNNFIMFGEV